MPMVSYGPQWLQTYYRGIDTCGKISIIWEGKYVALVKEGGGNYWASIGSQGYAPTRWEVIRKEKKDYWGKPLVTLKEGGRAKKSEIEEMIRRAKELDTI